MSDERFDVVVIGAGIHGAGVAQAAAAHGHAVLVLEQHAPAYGTSSRSSKLIHGGLRYLESSQFALVRECLYERELLLELAPDLVRRVPFYLPIYRDTSRRPWQIRAGLSLYALLGGMGRDVRFRRVARHEWNDLDGTRTDNLRAVFQYWDAQTDDAALTRAVLRSAQSLNARCHMPARFNGAHVHNDGCEVHYEMDGQARTCATRVIINAAGPWVTEVLQKITPVQQLPSVDLVQGTHIVVDGTLRRGIYYIEAPRDRRAVFVMPWKDRILIGTTETRYTGDPANVHALPQEIDYLLETYRHYFPRAANPTVHEAFAGLRVLPLATGSAFHRPRDTLLLTDYDTHPRVVSIVGGKLTAYRATAEKIMQKISSSLPRRRAIADTRALHLHAT